jgi:PadR family transcriptional regulator
VLQGTLDIMVLQTLAALGPSHGYTMAARIEQVSGGRVQLNMGTLYPCLMRLERGTWGVTENNRKARFYALTPAGKSSPPRSGSGAAWSPPCRRFSTSRADVRCYPRVAAPTPGNVPQGA